MTVQRKKITRSLAPWSTDGKPPREFCLFYFGANESTKGTVYLTKESATRCVASWQDYGNALLGDYEHAVTQIQSDGAPASCRFDLAIKQDGLYAVNVRWTPRAQKYFADKEYFYYSPYFSAEKAADDKWLVVEIINVALTNNPATKNQRPLIAVSWGRKAYNYMLSQELIDKLKALVVEKGMPEESASDFLLALMSMLEMGEKEEAPAPAEMPLADVKPEEQMPMADPMPSDTQALSKVLSALQAQLSAQSKEIAELRKDKQGREQEKRNELFSKFKGEGRLRFAKEADARLILDKHGVDAFTMAFGAVEPIVAQVAPKGATVPNVNEVVSPTKAKHSLGSIAPVFSQEEVESFMKRPGNDKLTYRQALSALSRSVKG